MDKFWKYFTNIWVFLYNGLIFMVIWFYLFLFADFLISQLSYNETQINYFNVVAFIMRMGSILLAYRISDHLKLEKI